MQRLVRTGVEPRHPAAHELDPQLPALEVVDVDIRYLQLTPIRGCEVGGHVEYPVVVEVQARHGVVRPGPLRLLLDAEDRPIVVELHDTVALGVPDVVPEHGGPALPSRRPLEEIREALAEEDVVPEDERDALGPDELPPDDESLGESLGPWLHGVGEIYAPLRTVAEQILEAGEVLGRGDHEYVPDPREHQSGHGVVDHRLVVDGQELLAYGPRQRVQPRPRTSCEHDPLHAGPPRLPNPSRSPT